VSSRYETRGSVETNAGYVYSGPIAAGAFASLPPSQSRFLRCVLIGPSHFVPFKGIAAPSFTSFSTPLGELPVDTVAVKGLLIEGHTVIEDAPHERDHAIEVELSADRSAAFRFHIGPCRCRSYR
jgi:MEMO1 family protein